MSDVFDDVVDFILPNVVPSGILGVGAKEIAIDAPAKKAAADKKKHDDKNAKARAQMAAQRETQKRNAKNLNTSRRMNAIGLQESSKGGGSFSGGVFSGSSPLSSSGASTGSLPNSNQVLSPLGNTSPNQVLR